MDFIFKVVAEFFNVIFTQDFWKIIAPLILSVVAIGVSIHTAIKQNQISERQNEIAEKQNEIALFEYRYKAVSILNFLLPVAREILKSLEQEEVTIWNILANSMQTYKYSSSPFETNIEYSQVEYFYTNLILEGGRLPCLFKNENTEQILSFLQIFNDLVSNECKGESCDKEIILLQNAVNKIDESYIFERLENYLML